MRSPLAAVQQRHWPVALLAAPSVVLGLLLLGLVVMHGIGLHTPGSGHANHGWSGATSVAPHEAHPTQPVPANSDAGAVTAVGSCVAVLLLGVALLRRPRALQVKQRPARPTRWTPDGAVVSVLPSRPPSLTALCVCRT